MPYVQTKDKRLSIGPGENHIGDAPDRALVVLDGNGMASIRGEPGADVKVNGVRLGNQPSPLLHGDKVELGGEAMSYGDDTRSGNTQYLSKANIADLLKAEGIDGGDTSSKLATGGRLVSLVDGREYRVGSGTSGFTIGRDPGCDVVIASGQVSRNHAEIELGADGYYIIDTSTNGIYVNGRRVEGTQTLNRSDVIKIGEEEFRFYADDGGVVEGVTPGQKTVIASAATPPSRSDSDAAAAQHQPSPADIPAPADATRVPVKQAEPETKSSGLPWWLWLLVAIILVAGVYFIIQGR